MSLYIKVGSVTNAQRSLKIVRSRGYKASIRKVENIKKNDGCGYEVVVNSDDKDIVKLLESKGIKVRGVELK